ncbi:MAG: tetratricopeptide repeat protein [Desulfonauticus sp.]|nr:tetratricopeptide repeat protein [Desulfonauticus sp.]
MRKVISVLVFWGVLSGVSLALAVDVNDLIFKASDLHYQGKLEEAEKIFLKVIQIDPKNEFALNQLGLLCAKRKKFSLAYKYFKRVVEISPDNTFARIWIGVLLLKNDKSRQAMQEFESVLKIDPYNANAYYFIGVIYGVEHNLKQSIIFLRKAQKVGSDDPETHYRLANAFLGLDMVYNAELELKRALALNPKHIKSLNVLGWVYFNQGKVDVAIAIWKKALRINTRDSEARHNLAKVYNELALRAYNRGDIIKAVEWWKKTLLFEPRNKSARYYLRKIKKR